MTSDYRVAGSSPAGCKSSYRADRLAIESIEESRSKMVRYPFFEFYSQIFAGISG